MMTADSAASSEVATPPPKTERVDPESGELIEAGDDETTEEEYGC